MENNYSYGLRHTTKATGFADLESSRSQAYRSSVLSRMLSQKENRTIAKNVANVPVFRPRPNSTMVSVPAPVENLPGSVVQMAKEYNIPLNSIRMNPVIRTTEGVMIFEEYIARIHQALEQDSFPRVAEAKPAPRNHEKLRAPRMPMSNTRLTPRASLPPSEINSSTIVADMPSPSSAALTTDTRKVVMIHNLNPEKLSVDALFTLCASFGDVDRVKIMYNKRDTAFVQMANISDCNSLVRHLQGLEVWGKCLVLVKSKMEEIRLPYSLDDRATVNLTKDYSNSLNRRFGKKYAQHRAYICSPTKMLHCSNLPENFDLEELKQLLDPKEELIEKILPIEDKPFMFNIVCIDVTCAVETLMFKHGMKYHGKKIRLSFTAIKTTAEK